MHRRYFTDPKYTIFMHHLWWCPSLNKWIHASDNKVFSNHCCSSQKHINSRKKAHNQAKHYGGDIVEIKYYNSCGLWKNKHYTYKSGKKVLKKVYWTRSRGC